LTEPDWIEPEAVDLLPIMRLHRAHDGHVTFHHRVGGAFRDLVSVPADELEKWFPEFVAQLDADSYFSVNAFYRGGNAPSSVNAQLPIPFRRRAGLRWLTACFADLDAYRSNISVGQVIGSLIDYQDQHRIPNASLMVRSGRGLWIFWLLRAEENGGPVRAWPEAIDLYRRAQADLGRRLAQLDADAAARDVCRVTRVPGSYHSDARRRVAYWFQADAQGHGFAYTLAELAEFLGLPVRPHHAAIRELVQFPEKSRAGKAGFRARWVKALRQFETLRALRGGFRRGTRSRACWLYAAMLDKARVYAAAVMSDADVRDAVLRLARECLDADGRPDPLPDREALDAAAVPRLVGLRDQTISDWLAVSPDEAARLEGWPPASRYGRTPTAPEPPREVQAQIRRDYVAERVRQLGRVETLRELQSYLGRLGVPACLRTIRRDLEALCLKNPREQRPKSQRNPHLF